jgi:hypothetical protein
VPDFSDHSNDNVGLRKASWFRLAPMRVERQCKNNVGRSGDEPGRCAPQFAWQVTCGIFFGLALIFSGVCGGASAEDHSGVWVVRAPATWPEWIRNWVGESYGISFVKDGRKFCGILSWVKDVSDGQPVEKDTENANPALRNRGLLGLTIATGLSEEPGNFTSGRFYFPPSGTYHAIKISFEKPAAKSAIVESADVVLTYGWCPLCWEFKQITLEKRRANQLPPPIKGSGPCRFQE